MSSQSLGGFDESKKGTTYRVLLPDAFLTLFSSHAVTLIGEKSSVITPPLAPRTKARQNFIWLLLKESQYTKARILANLLRVDNREFGNVFSTLLDRYWQRQRESRAPP